MTAVDRNTTLNARGRLGERGSYPSGARVVVEQESIFSAPDGTPLPDLNDLAPGLTPGVREHDDIGSDFYDTSDLALAAAGITVRFDRADVADQWAVLLPATDCNGQAVRREVRFSAGAHPVPGGVHRALPSGLRRRHLECVANVNRNRVVAPLVSRGGVRLAEVIDETVSIRQSSGASRSFREVRVEVADLSGVGHALLEATHARLLHAGFHPETPSSDLVLAFPSVPDQAQV
jgi:hypothetical protein